MRAVRRIWPQRERMQVAGVTQGDDGARFVVGIDPGAATGRACWDPLSKELVEVSTSTIAEALRDVADWHRSGRVIRLVFEDARLRRGWFGAMDAKQLKHGAGVREGVGSVKRDCAVWQEWAELHRIPFKAVSPQEKGVKLDAALFGRMTGWTARTSQHGRDAAMLVFGLRG